MTTSETLKRARKLVAAGWSEPVCRDARGRICSHTSEGVASFDVESALRVACGDVWTAESWAALVALESTALPAASDFGRAAEKFLASGDTADAEAAIAAARVPGAGWTLTAWLEQQGRTQADVLAAFDRAILRAQAMESKARGT